MIFLSFFLVLLTSFSATVHAMKSATVTSATKKLYRNYKNLDPFSVARYIQEGADVNYTPRSDKPTLLMCATRRSLDDMKILLENKADVNKRVNHRTALLWAIEEEDLKKVTLLLKYKPRNLCTAYALTKGDLPIIEVILAREKQPLIFMRALMPSLLEGKLPVPNPNALMQLFLEINTFDESMFIPVINKIYNDPFNNDLMNLFTLFCKYKYFNKEALRLAEITLSDLKEKLATNALTVGMNEERLKEYMADKKRERRLEEIISLLAKNNPSKNELQYEYITFYPHTSTF